MISSASESRGKQIIRAALQKGFKSGGKIGDISGGIPAKIGVKKVEYQPTVRTGTSTITVMAAPPSPTSPKVETKREYYAPKYRSAIPRRVADPRVNGRGESKVLSDYTKGEVRSLLRTGHKVTRDSQTGTLKAVSKTGRVTYITAGPQPGTVSYEEKYTPKSVNIGFIPSISAQKTQVRLFQKRVEEKKLKEAGFTPGGVISAYKGSKLDLTGTKLAAFSEREKGSYRGILAGVAATGYYAGKGFFDVYLHPYQTARGVVTFPYEVTKAVITGQGLYGVGEELRARPEKVIGETVGTAYGIKTAIAISPRFTYEKAKIPVESQIRSEFKTLLAKENIKYVSTTKQVTYRGLGIETPKALEYVGIKAASEIAGIKSGIPKGRIKIGMTDISPELKRLAIGTELGGSAAVKSKSFSASTALQTKILGKSLIKLVKEGQSIPSTSADLRLKYAIPVSKSLIAKTITTKSKFKTGIEFSTERLSKRGVSVILDIAKREGGTIFGSFSRRTQIPRSISKFVPRDIDVRIPGLDESSLLSIKKMTVSRLGKAGIKARMSPSIKEAVEVKVGRQWQKAVEFKGGKLDLISGEAVPEKVLGFRKEGRTIKSGGLEFTKLSEELRGVIQGVVRVRKTKKGLDIYPPAKRVKDIYSTIISAKTLEQSQFFKRGLKADIANFEKLFGRPYYAKGEKVLIGDYSPGSISTRIKIPSASSILYGSSKTSAYSISTSSRSTSRSTYSPSSYKGASPRSPYYARSPPSYTPSIPSITPPSYSGGGSSSRSRGPSYGSISPYIPKGPSPYYGLPSPSPPGITKIYYPKKISIEPRRKRKQAPLMKFFRPYKFTSTIVPAEFGIRRRTGKVLTGVSPRYLMPTIKTRF